MKKHLYLLILLPLLFIFSCEKEKSRSKRPKKIQLNFFNVEYKLKKYTINDSIPFHFTNLDEKNTLDSITIFHSGEQLITLIDSFTTIKAKELLLGSNRYQFKAYFSDLSSQVKTKSIHIWPIRKPKILNYEVIGVYEHSKKSYTQGLEFDGEDLVESTGQYGASSINRTNPYTGEVKKSTLLPNSKFGEGSTIIKDKIYQLTWKSNLGYIYDKNSLAQIDSFQYPEPIEGWGLTHSNSQLIVSNGTSLISFWNSSTLKKEKTLNVVDHNKNYEKINELELVAEKLYANIYTKNIVLEIDIKTGEVTGLLDLKGLLSAEDRQQLKDPYGEVLNGIAYHSKRKTFFVTGKHWPKTFEIKIN